MFLLSEFFCDKLADFIRLVSLSKTKDSSQKFLKLRVCISALLAGKLLKILPRDDGAILVPVLAAVLRTAVGGVGHSRTRNL